MYWSLGNESVCFLRPSTLPQAHVSIPQEPVQPVPDQLLLGHPPCTGCNGVCSRPCQAKQAGFLNAHALDSCVRNCLMTFSLVYGLACFLVLLVFFFTLNQSVIKSLGCCTESWTLELTCLCTASQASLLGHLGHVHTLPYCGYWRSRGSYWGKISFGQWTRFGTEAFSYTVVLTVVGGTVFGHEPQLIHCTWTTKPFKRLGIVKTTAVSFRTLCHPAHPLALLGPGRTTSECRRCHMASCLPRCLPLVPGRDWTVRCVYSACVTGVRAGPLLYFFLSSSCQHY